MAKDVERAWAEAGALVVSNTACHRMDPRVPLLVPEVNADHLQLLGAQAESKGWSGGIVTNPNCSTVVLAMAGVAWALADPQSRGAGNIWGDLLALLASWAWAGIALNVRLTRTSELNPEGQLFWQLAVSAVVLCVVAPLFGPLWRETGLLSLFGLAYGVLVASLGFMFWLRLMGIYPASDIASFSFLSPVMAVVFGWLVFDEPVGPDFLGALALTSVGIVLINRR